MKVSNICPECSKGMKAIHCIANPPATEWYCVKCHKSVIMDKETAATVNAAASRK